MRDGGKPVLSLRGKFVAPDLVQQGMERRLERGSRIMVPVDAELVEAEVALMGAHGVTALWDLRRGEILCEIDCPAHCGALDPSGSLPALARGASLSFSLRSKATPPSRRSPALLVRP